MPEITISNFIRDYGNALDNRDGSQSKWIFKNPYNTLAVEYLERALNLIKNNPSRAERIDALSNIKRAVHRRTDTLLYLYWLRDRSNHYNWNFPNKCDALVEF